MAIGVTQDRVSIAGGRAGSKIYFLTALTAALVFFTELTFRLRKFQVNIQLDWQVVLQLSVWGTAGLTGLLMGALTFAHFKKSSVVACGALLFFMTISTLYSPVKLATLSSAIGYLTFFAYALALGKHCTAREALIGVVCGLSLDVLSAPLLHYAHMEGGAETVELTDAGRMHGLTVHAGELAGDAAVLALIAFVLGARSERPFWWRVLGFAALVVMGLTTEKMAIVAFALSGALVWWRHEKIIAALTPIWEFAVAAVGLMIATVGLNYMIPNEILRLMSRHGTALDAGTFSGRTKIWSFCIDQWMHRPIAGWGWNSGRYVIFGVFHSWTILQTHSMYLNCLLYTGVFGFGALVVLILARLSSFFRSPDVMWDWIFLFVIFGASESKAHSPTSPPSSASSSCSRSSPIGASPKAGAIPRSARLRRLQSLPRRCAEHERI